MIFSRCAVTLVAIVALLAITASAFALAAPSCPKGERAVQSEAEITSNGCGVPGLHIQMDGSEFFEKPCCDLHDACYSICGADRDECEKSFERCMEKGCGKAGSQQMTCKSAAQTFSMGTKAMGHSAFQKAQEAGCQCIDADDAQTISDAYMPHAERVYRKALGDVEADEKIENFRENVLPKHYKKKSEWTVLKNLFERYPDTITFEKEGEKKKEDL